MLKLQNISPRLGVGDEGMGDQFTYQKYKVARKLKSVLSSFPF